MKQLCILISLHLGLLVGFFAPLQAQKSSPVYLHHGAKNIPANVDKFAQQPGLQAEFQQYGKAYRLLQFAELPTASQRKKMAESGLELLDYVPHFAYLAAFSPQFDMSQLASFDVQAVYELTAADKSSPQVAEQDFPPHALIGNQVALQLTLMPDVPETVLRQQLSQIGAEIEKLSVPYQYARIQLPIEAVYRLTDLSSIQFVDAIQAPGEPEDIRGLSLHRSNVLNSNYPGARNYDGSGVSVAVRDDGDVGPHIDFEGRLDNHLASSGNGTHGDRVAGCVGGTGNLDPTIQGMAPGAYVYAMDYQADFLDSTIALHTQSGVMVTNSSYSNGCNAGYTVITRIVDAQAYNNPNLLHVFSAGNSNGSDCGYGAGNQWGNVTGGHKMGKNVLTVAASDISDQIAGFSSRGPAHDGRIKPDISALGSGVRMPYPNNTYGVSGGTSFSAPAMAGVAAQLYHAYRELNNGDDPSAALIKATLLNTADDVGNAGPDFIYGWGRVNARQAVEVLEGSQHFSAQVSQGDSLSFQLTVPPNTKEARIMLYWAEEAASILSDRALTNDLNLKVIDGSGQTHLPWLLDHTPNATTLNAPATTGRDSINNMEQVLLTDPQAGSLNLAILGDAIPKGPQEFYIVYAFLPNEIQMTYPIGGESFVPGITERIRWDALGNGPSAGPFSLEYSLDGGSNWQLINGNIAASTRFYDWGIPASVTGEARLRISRGALSGSSIANFNIIGQPQNLTLEQVCPTFLSFSWDAVAGATGYDVFLLGEKYMDSVLSIGASPNPLASIPIQQENDVHWVSVRAIGANAASGRRGIALEHTGGRFNCPIDNDVALNSVSLNSSGPFVDCRDYLVPVKVQLLNQSSVSLGNFPVSYQLDNGPIVNETFSGTLIPNDPISFTFAQLADLNGVGTHILTAWTNLPLDTILVNDSSSQLLEVLPGQAVSLPYVQDFEGFVPCGTASNCDLEICDLTEGWINESNGSVDDIDWRVDRSGTPSNGTGPSQDHRPGLATGNYLYLEASGGCEGQTANLVSPCFDLSGLVAPEFHFWYHMDGNDMGDLHIDANINGNWILDFGGVISGDQGNDWEEQTVNLIALAGQVINIRLRGTTGQGFSSDMAIDDISVYDAAGPPAAYFIADREQNCVGAPISLIESSLNNPTSWAWSFTPNLVTYLNGTSASSQQPAVSFSQAGWYEVQLVASNASGSDTLLRTQYLDINPGTGPDLMEDFESPFFPPLEWSLNNPDGGNTWGSIGTVGIQSSPTNAAYVNNNNQDPDGERDELTPLTFNLDGADQPVLFFDLAYARANNGSTDALLVELSMDCGETFPVELYEKVGPQLASVSVLDGNWFPQTGDDWRTDSVSLDLFTGMTVMVRFVNRNGFGTSNNLFLDNIRLLERGAGAPSADFNSSAAIVCEGTALNLFDASQGVNISSYVWDFGADATPASASTAGPHAVSYTSPGTKTITLTTGNANGSTSISKVIEVLPLPDPEFAYTRIIATFSFSNTSVNADSFLWVFGDGGTSTMAEPEHEYLQNGVYEVMLIAYNDCGADTLIESINLTTVGADDLFGRAGVSLFPNPSQGQLELLIELPGQELWQIEVSDLRGRTILRQSVPAQGSPLRQMIDLGEQADGMYLIHLEANGVRQSKKLLLQR